MLLELIIISGAAGVVGTGLGGIIGLLFGGNKNPATGLMLSFAGGVMVSVVCFDLIPEALELAGLTYAIIGVVIGILCVYYLDKISRYVSKKLFKRSTYKLNINKLYLKNISMGASLNFKASMLRAGIVMLIAISLHNLPEGMAIGSVIAHNQRLGIGMALLIGMHDIPEGMSITLPLVAGGMGKIKAFLYTLLSGFATVVGALLGYALGSLSDEYMALCVAGAGGAMLYVTYCEILPKSFDLDEGRLSSAFSLIGIVCGLFVRFAFIY